MKWSRGLCCHNNKQLFLTWVSVKWPCLFEDLNYLRANCLWGWQCLRTSDYLILHVGVTLSYHLVQFSSVTQSCLTLWDPMNRSTPGLPVHHQLPEFTQTHVHRHPAISSSIVPFSSCPQSLPRGSYLGANHLIWMASLSKNAKYFPTWPWIWFCMFSNLTLDNLWQFSMLILLFNMLFMNLGF